MSIKALKQYWKMKIKVKSLFQHLSTLIFRLHFCFGIEVVSVILIIFYTSTDLFIRFKYYLLTPSQYKRIGI